MATTIFLRDYSDIQDYVKYKDGKLVREEGAAKDATVEMLKTIMNDVQENAQNVFSSKRDHDEFNQESSKEQRPDSKINIKPTAKSKPNPASPVCIIRDLNDRSGDHWKNQQEPQIYDKKGAGKMQQYVGILRHVKDNEEYYVCIRSRFDRENSFFTEYILSRVMKAWGFYFGDKQVFGDMGEVVKQLLTIVFLHQIAQYYNETIKLSNRNAVNILIMRAYKKLAQEWNEKDSLWIKEAAAKKIIHYMRSMDQDWRINYRSGIESCHYIDPNNFDHLGRAAQTAYSIFCLLHPEHAEKMTTGILFDMNYLWELYLQCVFNEYCGSIGCQLLYQKSENYLFPIAERPGDGEEQNIEIEQSPQKEKQVLKSIRPDFCFEKEEQTILILDAKNKPVWKEVLNTGILTFSPDCKDSGHSENSEETDWKNKNIREDIYEVLTYMYVLGCPVGGIICPFNMTNKKNGKDENEACELLAYKIRKNKPAKFFAVGLLVDGASENQDDLPETSESRQTSKDEFGYRKSFKEIPMLHKEYGKYKNVMLEREKNCGRSLLKLLKLNHNKSE